MGFLIACVRRAAKFGGPFALGIKGRSGDGEGKGSAHAYIGAYPYAYADVAGRCLCVGLTGLVVLGAYAAVLASHGALDGVYDGSGGLVYFVVEQVADLLLLEGGEA